MFTKYTEKEIHFLDKYNLDFSFPIALKFFLNCSIKIIKGYDCDKCMKIILPQR